jgi:hypothetical protein
MRPTSPGRLRPPRPRQRPPARRTGPRRVPLLPDPRNRPPRPHPQTMERRLPGLLQHRPRIQRRNRSRERLDRTPPPHRPRLPQPRQLTATHAPHRRRTHHRPTAGMKSQGSTPTDSWIDSQEERCPIPHPTRRTC